MTITNCPMCQWEIPELSEPIRTCLECGADLSRWTARRKQQPPPIPVQVESKSSGGWFAGQAATFSLAVPFVAIAVNWFSREAIRGNRIALMLVGGTTVLLILSGFILGVVALFLQKKGEGKGTIGKAIAGVCINGLLIASMLILVPIFIKTVERIKELQRQRQEQQQR